MATSPNYGWAEPDNTDLVKNGALAIRTLGNDIDTTMATKAVASNPFINSAFQVWQRGTTGTTTSGITYPSADRWNAWTFAAGGSVTLSRQVTGDTTNLPNIQYCGRFQRVAGNTNTGILALGQAMESVNSIPYAGKTVTISYYARKGANFSATSDQLSVQLWSAATTDSSLNGVQAVSTTVVNSVATLTSTWQRFSATGTVGTTATQLAIAALYAPTGTAGANDYFEITGVQIDVGSVALPFQTASGGSIQGELAMCQRYYEKSYTLTSAAGANDATGSYYLTQASDSANNSAVAVRFRVEKRNGSWSAALYTPTGTVNNWQYARSGVASANVSMTIDLQASSGFRAYGNIGAAWTANTIQGHWVVDNEL